MPLYVQVVTQPALLDCWSVNLSSSGLGLMAHGHDPSERLAEGDELDVEFQLPDSRTKIRARARLAWLDEQVGPAEGQRRLSLGLQFSSIDDRDRLELNRYLQAHRFHVAVAFCTRAELARVNAAVDEHTRTHAAADEAAVEEILARGDISALVVCANEEPRAHELIRRFGTTPPIGERGPLWARDHAPRVIVLGAPSPARLLELFNMDCVYRVLPADAEPAAVGAAIHDACRDLGVRAEQWRVAVALERALLRERARAREAGQLSRATADIVAVSREMQRVMEEVKLVAPLRMAVLLHGETGTGKEVLARAIHRLSERAHAPFVVQDCGALPETLLDSELFGHVRGAFTGALLDHAGLFSMADGGTIFLDEIENTSPALQSKLLRVIETGEVRPVGGTRTVKVDARLVCASNRDLEAEVQAGRFRSDLYYRLSTFPIEIAPLRERRHDILPLARRFIAAFAASVGQPAPDLDAAAAEALMRYHWPGNARQLRNALERAVLLSRGGPVTADRLPAAVQQNVAVAGTREVGAAGPLPTLQAPAAGTLDERLADVERQLIGQALAEHNGVVSQAARALGMNRITFARRARRHGLGS